MQYLKKFNEGFFDFLKPKIKKVYFTKKEIELIYSKISKMINSPFRVMENDNEIYNPDHLYSLDIKIISYNIPISTKKSTKSLSDSTFYFKDKRMPNIKIVLTKSSIGNKIEYYISSVIAPSYGNWIESNNTWIGGQLEYNYIEKYNSINGLMDGIVEYSKLFILSHCLDIDQIQKRIGFINLKNICNDYSILNKNNNISKFRIVDMIDEINDDYDIIPKFDSGLVIRNLKSAGFNII